MRWWHHSKRLLPGDIWLATQNNYFYKLEGFKISDDMRRSSGSRSRSRSRRRSSVRSRSSSKKVSKSNGKYRNGSSSKAKNRYFFKDTYGDPFMSSNVMNNLMKLRAALIIKKQWNLGKGPTRGRGEIKKVPSFSWEKFKKRRYHIWKKSQFSKRSQAWKIMHYFPSHVDP